MNVNMKFLWQTTQMSSELSPLCCSGLTGPDGTAPGLSEDRAEELAQELKALADPVRLRLVSIIAAAGEACTCDLPEAIGRSQPTVSHHLKVLVEAGLVDREQRGKWAWFRVRPEALERLSAVFRVHEHTPA